MRRAAVEAQALPCALLLTSRVPAAWECRLLRDDGVRRVLEEADYSHLAWKARSLGANGTPQPLAAPTRELGMFHLWFAG